MCALDLYLVVYPLRFLGKNAAGRYENLHHFGLREAT
jgi:hypothetical protein